MAIPSFAKAAAIRGIGVFGIAIRMSIDILKVAFWGVLAYLGWWVFHSLDAWYWSAIGVILMLNGLGAILPAIDIVISLIILVIVLIDPNSLK